MGFFYFWCVVVGDGAQKLKIRKSMPYMRTDNAIGFFFKSGSNCSMRVVRQKTFKYEK